MKTQSEKYDKRIEELEEKFRTLGVWSSGKIFKFITLGSVTVVGAGVLLQQQTQLESQRETITFLFDKLKEVHGESKQCKEKLNEQSKIIKDFKEIYNKHSHKYSRSPDCGCAPAATWESHETSIKCVLE